MKLLVFAVAIIWCGVVTWDIIKSDCITYAIGELTYIKCTI